MLKKEITNHLLVSVIWLTLVSLLRWDWRPYLILFWSGGLMGTFLLDLDHLIYILVLCPQELTSLRVRKLIDQRRFREVIVLLADTSEERLKFCFHNALFQPIFFIFCFWVLTSTASWFGKGVVMAMALHLLKDEIHLLLKGKDEQLRRWLFWPIKREISFSEQKIFVILMLLVFGGLNLLLI